MTRADLEAAAEEKYRVPSTLFSNMAGQLEKQSIYRERAAYIRGRLDQAEADARIAEDGTQLVYQDDWSPVDAIFSARERIAAAIRKGVE